jgi:branched-chain amino acid transport system permease protein
MILALLRVVNSPFGRVLQAIRENRFRAEALGYRTVFHLTYANCIAALVAASAGALNALWLRYAGPDTSLSFAIMLDILLMVVIGGMGTMYGAIIGAAIFILAQNYLQALMGAPPMPPPTPDCRCCRACCIRIAGCCGLACCSSPACISSRPASWR